jgi:1-acyl-sn-glycerol-3-phosphate acyltransferase
MLAQMRRLGRLITFGILSFLVVLEFLLLASWRSSSARYRYQARWFYRHAKWANRLIGLHPVLKGHLIKTPLLVCNHLSYLDIFVLAELQPVIFISMAEVKKWPWGGLLARCAGTIFVERQRKSDLIRVNRQIEEIIAAGITVVFFPEATTSDGTRVLPFHSSLLEVAVKNGWPVLPCHLSYRVNETGNSEAACWHDSQPFFPHLMQFLLYSSTDVQVQWGIPQRASDRKTLAKQLHEEVSRMHFNP